jgi:hypothetical protein
VITPGNQGCTGLTSRGRVQNLSTGSCVAAPQRRRRIQATRFYDWAWLDDGGWHSLLIRKNTSTGELAFYRCWTPAQPPSPNSCESPGSAGPSKKASRPQSQVGLDRHQVRRWRSWHRFTTLALAALVVLAICAADAATRAADEATGLINLTVNEVRRLINVFIIRPISDLAYRLHWSGWRRLHQTRARRSHYTRRLNLELQP